MQWCCAVVLVVVVAVAEADAAAAERQQSGRAGRAGRAAPLSDSTPRVRCPHLNAQPDRFTLSARSGDRRCRTTQLSRPDPSVHAHLMAHGPCDGELTCSLHERRFAFSSRFRASRICLSLARPWTADRRSAWPLYQRQVPCQPTRRMAATSARPTRTSTPVSHIRHTCVSASSARLCQLTALVCCLASSPRPRRPIVPRGRPTDRGGVQR